MRKWMSIAIVVPMMVIMVNCKDIKKENGIIGQMSTIGEKAADYYKKDNQKVFPKSTDKDCTSGQNSSGIWKALKIDKLSPSDITYCYKSSSNAKKFAVSAEYANTLYCIHGEEYSTGPSVGSVVVGASSCEP